MFSMHDVLFLFPSLWGFTYTPRIFLSVFIPYAVSQTTEYKQKSLLKILDICSLSKIYIQAFFLDLKLSSTPEDREI